MSTGFAGFDLPDPLLRGLAKAGWSEPTPVQAAVLPPALAGGDLMVTAATGSGKTGAFLLPMMTRFLADPRPRGGTRGLVLVPTRELARQVRDHFLGIAGHTRLTATILVGGENRGHQVAALRRNPDLLIATPGRLLEHLGSGEARLNELEVLVLDEADRMLDLGFGADVLAILAACNPARQSLLFSATLEHRGLRPIIGDALREPEVIVVDQVRGGGHPDIDHQVIYADDPAHKQRLLVWLLQQDPAGAALVFANTRVGATALANALMGAGVRCALLHGELDQLERRRVLGLFTRGEVRALVATDVAARGLDIPGVGLVINAEPPRSGDDYLHRTGRTGRAGARGLAISLVAAADFNRMESITRYLGLSPELRAIDGLVARFQGPTRPKGGPRRKPAPKATAKAAAPKVKERLRDRKNIGKRRVPSGTGDATPAGEQPPRRRPPDDGPRD